MSRLFGDQDDRTAKRAAASAEIERLTGLSARELAAEVLPLFAPAGPPGGPLKTRHGSDDFANRIADRFVAPFGRGSVSLQPRAAEGPIKEAIQVLVTAGLLLQDFHSDGGLDVFVTRLGQEAINHNDVASYLTGPPR